MHTQYCAQNKRFDFYFSEHKLGLEIDEYGQQTEILNMKKVDN